MIVVNLEDASDEAALALSQQGIWVVGPELYYRLREFAISLDLPEPDHPFMRFRRLWNGLFPVRVVVNRYMPDWYVVGAKDEKDSGTIPGASIMLTPTETEKFDMRLQFAEVMK